MAIRNILVAIMFLGTGLTGCLSGDDAPTEAATNDDLNSTQTEVPGGRTIIAFEETNETEEGAGGVNHHHDYWEGRERVEIFKVTATMEALPDDQNRVYATFRPPAGTFVYESTKQVEFTLSNPKRRVCEPVLTLGGELVCTDNAGYHTGGQVPNMPVSDPTGGPTGLTLRYKHASTVEWIDAGPIGWGEALAIQITNPVQTDMPHATSSVWEFQVVSPNPQDITLSFDATAELVRGPPDTPLWPGHPLFYTPERPVRVVVDQKATACDGSACALASDAEPVIPEKIISYGTRTLYVWVNITNAQMPNPATAPNTWFLYHNNATNQQNLTSPFDTTNYPVEKLEHAWVIPVDDGGMDSPYADGSRWKFSLGGALMTPTGLSCYGGCADWIADYTIVIHASSIELAPKDYHMNCLRDDVYCPSPE